jgi:hypothetical protein
LVANSQQQPAAPGNLRAIGSVATIELSLRVCGVALQSRELDGTLMWDSTSLFLLRFSSKAAYERMPGCQSLKHNGDWSAAKLAAEVRRVHHLGAEKPSGSKGSAQARFFGSDGDCNTLVIVLATEEDHPTFAREFFTLLQPDSNLPAQPVAAPEQCEAGTTAWTTVMTDVVLVLADPTKTSEDIFEEIGRDLASDVARFLEGQWHEVFLARERYLGHVRDILKGQGWDVKERRDELVNNFTKSLDTPAAEARANELCRYLVPALADLTRSGHEARQVKFTIETACANLQRFSTSLATRAAQAIVQYRMQESQQVAGLIDRDLAMLNGGVHDVRWLLEACETFFQQQENREQRRRERKLTWLGIWLGVSQILLGITAFWPAAVTANIEADFSREGYVQAMWFLAAPSLLILSGTGLMFCTFYFLLSSKPNYGSAGAKSSTAAKR